MDNGGEAARTTVVGSTGLGMAIAVQEEEGEAYMGTGTFHVQLGSAAARRASVEPTAAAYHNPAASGGAVRVAVFHLEHGTAVVLAQAQQTLRGIGRAQGVAAGGLRGRNLGAGYDGYGALVDDVSSVYDNPGMVAQHLRLHRLLPLAGIGACAVAVNGLATGPGSPAVALHLFVLLLAGLLLVILHVLRLQ